MKILVRYAFIAVPILSVLLSACMFTGVENTGHIKLSKDDIKAVNTLSAEDALISEIRPDSVCNWQVGKPFLATSDRTEYIFTAPEANPYGKILRYRRSYPSTTPSGKNAFSIIFSDAEGREYLYTREGGNDFTSADIPMMLDIDLVARVDSLLRGRTVYPRTRFWQSPDNDDKIIAEQQLVPVVVERVEPHNAEYPCKLIFSSNDGKRGALFFNPDLNSSRSFSTQFAITDPRLSYPKIEPEKWAEIQKGRLLYGMTKQEVRLAVGNPDDIQLGHDYSKVIELWQYSDGTYLRFEDGLLVSFRR